MAGRGVSVIVQLLSPTGVTEGRIEEMSLLVALHSPLSVFKQQLSAATGIDPGDQVLILCDLSDPDRNNDIHLDNAHDNITLRDCRFRNGSILTLHALGISAEKAQVMMSQAQAAKREADLAAEQANIGSTQLQTQVPAHRADHSFNGIIFDLKVKDAHEVDVMSISLAGMLGRVRIFARDCRWERGVPADTNDNYWGHHPGVSSDGWKVVADQFCRPSWDRPVEIRFNEPFKMMPHSRHAFYCHSGLPDDLGIQYQSCRKDTVSASDDHVAIMPGLGHCGSTPFGNRNTDGGWYRSYRTLAGSVRYRSALKGWNMREHTIFPTAMKQAVYAMLLAQKATPTRIDASRSLPGSPRVPSAPEMQRASSAPVESTHEKGEEGEEDDVLSPRVSPSGQIIIPPPSTIEGSLGLLNERFIVHNILEFCHYDWFDEAERELRRQAREEAATSRLGLGGGGGKAKAAGGGRLGYDDSDDEEDEDDEEEGYPMMMGGRGGGIRSQAAMRALLQRFVSSYGAAQDDDGNLVVDVDDLMQMVMQQNGMDEDDEDDDDEYVAEEGDDDDDEDEGEESEDDDYQFFDAADMHMDEGDDDDDDDDGEESGAGAPMQWAVPRDDDEASGSSEGDREYSEARGDDMQQGEEQEQKQGQGQGQESPGTVRTRNALENIARRIPNSFTLRRSPPSGAGAAQRGDDDEEEEEEDGGEEEDD
jgi:hypothetical protein